MQHPLVNPSLAPYGFVFPNYRTRLAYKSDAGWPNPEKTIVKAWEKAHRSTSARPWPIEDIVHRVLPAFATANRKFDADFEFGGLPYASRDILVLSSIVQWLATNVGNWFLTETPFTAHEDLRLQVEREFILKLEREESVRPTYFGQPQWVVFWTHICNEDCGKSGSIFGGPCHAYRRADASARDYMLARGLMYWLGHADGRALMESYLARRKRQHDAAFKNMVLELQKHIATSKAA